MHHLTYAWTPSSTLITAAYCAHSILVNCLGNGLFSDRRGAEKRSAFSRHMSRAAAQELTLSPLAHSFMSSFGTAAVRLSASLLITYPQQTVDVAWTSGPQYPSYTTEHYNIVRI